MKTDIAGKRIRFFEHRPRALLPTCIIYDQIHTLMPRQVANDFGIDPWDRIDLARPVAAKMRPGEPCGFMRLPLGRHAISLCGGEFGVNRARRRHCQASPQMKSSRIRKRKWGSFDFTERAFREASVPPRMTISENFIFRLTCGW